MNKEKKVHPKKALLLKQAKEVHPKRKVEKHEEKGRRKRKGRKDKAKKVEKVRKSEEDEILSTSEKLLRTILKKMITNGNWQL